MLSDVFGEARTGDVLRNEERSICLRVGCDDVGGALPTDSLAGGDLACEAPAELSVSGVVCPDDLDRDRASIACDAPVHDPHAAGAEAPDNSEAAHLTRVFRAQFL